MLSDFWPYLAITAGFFSGITALLEKRLLKIEHALAYTASITFIITIFSLMLLPLANFNITPLNWLLLYIYSITLTVSFWFTARLFRHGNISIASPIYKTLPILFVVILAFLFLGESLSLIQYGFIIILTVSAYLLINESKKVKESNDYRYNYQILILLDTIAVSIGLIILKYLLNYITIPSLIIIANVFTSLNLLILIIRRGPLYLTWFKNDMKAYANNIVLISSLTFFYRILFYLTISSILVSLAVPIANVTTIIITVLIGGAMFKEKNIFKKLLLALIMVISAYFLIVT
ncbi:MAG: EamA family transporter [Candidatus Micrarchaeia archaeon]